MIWSNMYIIKSWIPPRSDAISMRREALKCATLRGELSIGSCCTVYPSSITPALGVAFQEPCQSCSLLHFSRRFRNTEPVVCGTLLTIGSSSYKNPTRRVLTASEPTEYV